MTALITDRLLEERLIAERQATGADRWDEVWDGVYVMNPMADMEHQRVASKFVTALSNALEGLPAEVIGPINVSDREAGWTHNYRIPDAVVLLPDARRRTAILTCVAVPISSARSSARATGRTRSLNSMRKSAFANS